jgi:hypothetical protein
MIQTYPRNSSGIRSGQKRPWMKPREIFLMNEKAGAMVQFIPEGDKVTILGMSLSICGAWSEHVSSTRRNTLSIVAARKVYARLLKAGYRPY